MKQSGIVMSILIAGGVYASGYAFVSTHNPCVGDRSYECLFGQDDVQITELTGQNFTGQDLITPEITQQVAVSPTPRQTTTFVERDTQEDDTSLADQAAAAKLAKEEADAQLLAIEQETARIVAQQAAAEKLAAQEAANIAAQETATLEAQQATKYKDDENEYENEEEDD